MDTGSNIKDRFSGISSVVQPMHVPGKVRLAMVIAGTLASYGVAAVSSNLPPPTSLSSVYSMAKRPTVLPQKNMPAPQVSQAPKNSVIKLMDFHGTSLTNTAARPRQQIDFQQGSEPRYHFVSLLQPLGFKRKSWHSFDAIQPGDAVATATPTLTEVPSLPEEVTSQVAAKTANRFVIMLDPGHGGSDPGSEAHNGLLEKELTLDIAKRAQLFLSEIDGIDVLLTRDEDTGLSRQSRVNAVRRSQADLMVSLHFNNLPQRNITLVESFYAGPKNIAESQAFQRSHSSASRFLPVADSDTDMGFTLGSARLANMLQRRIFAEVSHANPAASNAGVKQDTLFVLTRSFTPGVLIEMTCLSNELEATRLADENYRNRLAAALVDGIRNYRASLAAAPLAEIQI
ncbi:MAG: N-acetylmuramoyl-L-alanine amidase [Granulosicoccus sp.]